MKETMELTNLTQMLPQLSLRGPVADPATFWLLDKGKIARLKVHQLDMAIGELDKQREFLELQQTMLKQEYKIR